jgi:hypothetical protein
MQTPYRSKFLTLSLVYTTFVVFAAILLMQAISYSTAGVRRGALATLIVFLTPNGCAFLITAFRLRSYWSRLVTPSLVVVSCISAVATVGALGAMSQILMPVALTVSPVSLLKIVAVMFLPGIAAAQLLRFLWGLQASHGPA